MTSYIEHPPKKILLIHSNKIIMKDKIKASPRLAL